MKQVQYSRIFSDWHRRPRRPFSYLFIRDFPLIALGVLPLLVLSLVNSSSAGIAPAATTEPNEEEVDFITLKSDIALQTCCPYQSQWSEDGGTCTEKSLISALHNDDNTSTGSIPKSFPGLLNVPQSLVATAYRNITWDRKFRLKQQMISCPKGTITINITLSGSQMQTSRRPKINGTTVFIPVNGYLRHNFDIFYPDEYCFNKINNEELQILTCVPECTIEKPCVPKCCDVGQVWDLTLFPDGPARCAFSPKSPWTPQIYADVKSKQPLSTVRPHIIISHPMYWCEEDSTIYTLKKFREEQRKPFRILSSGETWYKFDRRKWSPFTPGAHCLDGFFVRDGPNGRDGYSGKYEDTLVWDCGPPQEDPPTTATSQLYGISMIIASCFLFLTIVIYLLLWEKHNNYKNWILISYFTSLLFMYIVYSAVHFTSISLLQDRQYGGGTICYIIGVCAHFFFLSSFCFMTAVTFDLFWTFRALMPTGGKSKGIRKFLGYLLFALGIPTVIVGVGITLDQLYGDDPDSDIIVPEYGKKTCYVDREYATLPYLHGPAGILLTCNLVFFTVTVYTMYKIQQSTKFATMSSSKSAKQKQSVILFAKLFLVMGLPWVFEVISQTTQKGIVVPIFFQILDVINIFQAVAIFIIFVLKADIRNALENKYPSFRRFMLAITIRPEKADSILRRHPRLRFIINPLTRSITSTRSFSTAKTTLSNGTEGSTSSRRNVLGRRESDGFESTSSSSARSSPSGSLGGKCGEQKHPEILELREDLVDQQFFSRNFI